jgi:hypothetical protein
MACAVLVWAGSASAYTCASIIRLAHTDNVRDYMQGLSEGLLAANAASMKIKGSRLYCIPARMPFNPEVGIALIKQYVKDHPEVAEQNPAIVLQISLIELYPCH